MNTHAHSCPFLITCHASPFNSGENENYRETFVYEVTLGHNGMSEKRDGSEGNFQ